MNHPHVYHSTSSAPASARTHPIAPAGRVRVFSFSTNGSWAQLGDEIDGLAAGEEFGGAVAMNANGTILAVGAVHLYWATIRVSPERT